MTLSKAKARANKKFIVHASLTIVTYNHQNIFIVLAPVVNLVVNSVKRRQTKLECLSMAIFTGHASIIK
jgi:hypothetical protein